MVILLAAWLALLGLAEAFAIDFWQRSLYGQTALELTYGLVTAGIIFYLAESRTTRLGPIIMGRDLGDGRTALLCHQLPDRAVYRVQLDQEHPTGTIIPVCNGATAP